jgi:hypothetical protein
MQQKCFPSPIGTLNIKKSYGDIATLAYEAPMNGLIYLIGLIVVVMAILSFLGLH